jgi:hypothetical protein
MATGETKGFVAKAGDIVSEAGDPLVDMKEGERFVVCGLRDRGIICGERSMPGKEWVFENGGGKTVWVIHHVINTHLCFCGPTGGIIRRYSPCLIQGGDVTNEAEAARIHAV